MTGAVPAIPRPQFPWDQSERGMPLAWYYFEESLEWALRQDLASKVMLTTHDTLVNAVATDAYICTCDLAEACWLNFHRYAPL
ncbi:MAG: hypothetical protein ACPHN2_04675 [Sinimarinibacterium flocculans]|uniref:hypothetical protein n=1 Tax=Sinimarinibacterium flocculans TaxID=985250 RepID=UPI003C57A343